MSIHRRAFLGGLAAMPFVARTAWTEAPPAGKQAGLPALVKTSCNLYSFNEPLRSGASSLEQVFEYCAEVGFEAVDPTGYYFTGYPAPPSDEEIYRLKHRAFRLGLEISGTGVRNDFTLPEPARREAEIALVVRWIDVAAKLGAPVLRVFAGLAVPPGHTKDEATEWVVECLKTCAARGAERGVMIVLQNHDDVHKTAEETLDVRRRVGSEWLGLNVDIGSLRTGDPYVATARLAPFAYTWQVKENVYRNGREEPTDLRAIVRILRESRYRGYVPLETLGPGDPKIKVRRLLSAFREALSTP
jgi:sugar phosphate isomerase/epimerase